MKSIYIEKHGGTEVLTYGDLPEPLTEPGSVKVRIKACSVNRLDTFTRAGIRGTRLPLNKPHILGGDASGDIVEVGKDVTEVNVGDKVVINPRLTCHHCQYCMAGEEELCVSSAMLGLTTNGSYAEYAVVPSTNTITIPDTLSYEVGASLPTVFMPCWSILIRRAKLKPQETLLVLSASSGVGTAAIQIAKMVIGARVIATTSTDDKAQKSLRLGADEVINHSHENITKRVMELTSGHGVDVVLDHVGADLWPAAYPCLAPGGRYGICGVTSGYKVELQIGKMFMNNQTVFGVFMGRHKDLREIVALANKGIVKGVIDKTFPLKDAAKAHESMEARNFFGKLILTIP